MQNNIIVTFPNNAFQNHSYEDLCVKNGLNNSLQEKIENFIKEFVSEKQANKEKLFFSIKDICSLKEQFNISEETKNNKSSLLSLFSKTLEMLEQKNIPLELSLEEITQLEEKPDPYYVLALLKKEIEIDLYSLWSYPIHDLIKKSDLVHPKIQEELVKLAKEDRNASLWIKNYGIQEQSSLVEIAQAKAQASSQYDDGIAYLHEYGIQDQKDITNIIILALQNANKNFFHIKFNKFNLDPKQIYSILEFAYIRNISLSDSNKILDKIEPEVNQNQWLRLLKLAVANDPSLLKYIEKKFDKNDLKSILDLFKIAAKQNQSDCLKQIECLLKDCSKTMPNLCLEIAILLARQKGPETLLSIEDKEIPLDRDEDKLLVFGASLMAFPKEQALEICNFNSEFKQRFELENNQPFGQLIDLFSKDRSISSLAEIKQLLLSQAERYQIDIERNLAHLQHLTPVDQEKELAELTGILLSLIAYPKLSEDQIRDLNDLLKASAHLNPSLKQTVFIEIIDILIRNQGRDFFSNLKVVYPEPHLILSHLFLTALKNRGMEEKDVKQLAEQLSLLGDNFKEKNLSQAFYRLAAYCINEPVLTSKDFSSTWKEANFSLKTDVEQRVAKILAIGELKIEVGTIPLSVDPLEEVFKKTIDELDNIAKLHMSKTGIYSSIYLDNHGILDVMDVLILAQICTNKSKTALEYIRGYIAKYQDVFVECCLTEIKNNGLMIHWSWSQVGIPFAFNQLSEDNQLKIAIACLKASKNDVLEFVKSNPIFLTTVKEELKLLIAAFLEDPLNGPTIFSDINMRFYSAFKEKLGLETSKPFFKVLSLLAKEFPTPEIVEQAKKELKQQAKDYGVNLDVIVDSIGGVVTQGKTTEPIQRVESPFVQKKTLVWLEGTLLSIVAREDSQSIVGSQRDMKTKIPPILEQALQNCRAIHNPSLRQALSEKAIEVLLDKKGYDLFFNLNKTHGQSHFILFHFLLAALKQRGIQDKVLQNIAKDIHQLGTAFKNRRINESIYRLMLYCLNELSLNSEDIETIWKEAKPSSKEASNASKLRGIGELGGPGALKKTILQEKKDNIDTYFLETFQQQIPVTEREDFLTVYDKIVNSSRDPTAILRYSASLKKLCEPDRTLAIHALAKFVDDVLDGKEAFLEHRLQTDNNLHLFKVFSVRPDLAHLWKQECKLQLVDSVEAKEALQGKIKMEEFLYQKIITDNHLKGYPKIRIKAYLNSSIEEKKVIYTKLCQDISKASEKDRPGLEAQKWLIEILLDSFNQLSIQNKMDHLNKIQQAFKLYTWDAFFSDIESIRLQIRKADKASQIIDLSDYTLVETADPFDLLLCGTEIQGSCQHIEGNAVLNVGLLGYCLDGKNKLIAIKDRTGKLVARALFRIVWDNVKQEPVLMLARLYPAAINSAFEESIKAFAKQRAKELNLPLVSVEVGTGPDYPNPIEGLGGPAPFEFVDEGHGVAEKGVYTTRQAHYL